MLKPSRLSSLISSTSFPLNRCQPSSGLQIRGYTTRLRRWGIFKRHYGDFCTGADTAGIGLPRTGSGTPGAGWPRGGSTTGNRIPPTSPPTSGGGASSGATGEIFLTTRWASALPIRRARALQQFGRDRLGSQEADELLNTSPPDYTVEIAGFPTTIIRQGGTRFAAELRESARLAVPGRRPVAALSSDVPVHGMHLMATLSFPRFDDLHPKEGYVELSAAVRGMKLRERFKLKEMMYSGNLEL